MWSKSYQKIIRKCAKPRQYCPGISSFTANLQGIATLAYSAFGRHQASCICRNTSTMPSDISTLANANRNALE
jgi:hypothetical protein